MALLSVLGVYNIDHKHTIDEVTTMSTIIVEIPCQREPSVWEAYGDQDIIDIACSRYDFVYESWTHAEALDCWIEEDEIPEELTELLKENEKVIQVGTYEDSEFYSEAAAPTEIDAAKERIAHDMRNCFFFTVEEAKEFASAATLGNDEIDARIAVKKYLSNSVEL
jgi:hypothetical protein